MSLIVNEDMLEEDILNIFKSFGIEVKRSEEKLKDVNFIRDIAAKIQISKDQSNQKCGYLMVICPEDIARQIGVAFFQIPFEDLDELSLKDCVTELLNMMAEIFKKAGYS